ncbi:MAG: 16S rRNA (cytidine(1402)-2'-O)-methyltransferase [Nitrospiraceae bacterium]
MPDWFVMLSSFASTMTGTLYIVSTPIGNLDDITLRAVRILKQVAIVAAEDPRCTQALFAHHAITTLLTSYHNLNKEDKTPVLIRRLEEGQSVALVSDAGTPVISDPGAFLVAQAVASGIRVVPVPGPSAVLAALSASGLAGEAFVFLGSLPRQAGPRGRLLFQMRAEHRTLVLFESPGRLRTTLREILAVLGNRRMALAQDLTKSGETIVRGTAEELLRRPASRSGRGEITLVVAGSRHGKR